MGVSSFLAADTLGIELMEKADSLWGAAAKAFPVLTWKLDAWVQVQSDVVFEKECALWVSITKRLWLYLIIGTKASYVLVFDAGELGITFDKSDSFGGTTITETVTQIRETVKAVFKYNNEKETWVKAPADCLDKLIGK